MNIIKKNNQLMKAIKIIHSGQKASLFGMALFITIMLSGCAGQPMRASLPMIADIPASQSMQIDGVYKISGIGKNIRIESGRAYAIDSWLHLGLLKVYPNMVIIKDIQPGGFNEFVGYDLPLLGNWQATRMSDGNLKVSVAGAFGPVSYKLLAVDSAGSGDSDDYNTPDNDNDYAPTPPPTAQLPFPVEPIRKAGNTSRN